MLEKYCGVMKVKYNRVIGGTFIDRPNRFIAHVMIDGVEETVHVKNTARCREILERGVTVYLAEADNPNRKTKYDLIAARNGKRLYNIDSQAPNRVVAEWLAEQDYSAVIPEYTYGNSRVDFYMDRDGEKYLLEVKGCTQECDGIGYFPDAPTERGVKHLRELARAVREGYHAGIVFVIQMDGISEVRPNVEIHPEFGEALKEAIEAGVTVQYLPCHVEPDGIWAKGKTMR